MVELFAVVDECGVVSQHLIREDAEREVGHDAWLAVVRVWLDNGVVDAEMVDSLDFADMSMGDKDHLLEVVKNDLFKTLEGMEILRQRAVA